MLRRSTSSMFSLLLFASLPDSKFRKIPLELIDEIEIYISSAADTSGQNSHL